jgi:hypothetical protein
MQKSLAECIVNESDPAAEAFYRRVLEILNASEMPYLVGGAYALNWYTGVRRHTKDLDIFIRRDDYPPVSALLMKAGYRAELTYPHWLAKVSDNGNTIDLIFSSGNGVAEVDEDWFAYAVGAQVMDLPARLCPVEEMIWSKAFVMERERFDGADIVHLILTCAAQLDWQRLMSRFEPHWRLLLSHLVLFGFVYPAQRDRVPAWVMEELLERLHDDIRTPPPTEHICLGPLLSREQYLTDIGQWGYDDARVSPLGNMSVQDTVTWTDAIKRKDDEH